jgi:protein-tyrosine phosphatase
MQKVSNPLFSIATVRLENRGSIGLCRLPGLQEQPQEGKLEADVAAIQSWRAALVVSLTQADEMARLGAGQLSDQLATHHIAWRHFPIVDYGVPEPAVVAGWPVLSQDIKQVLSAGQNVLLHCRGGIGRSGMVALRLMIELGEKPEEALQRLRLVRSGAVETEAQLAWAKAQP